MFRRLAAALTVGLVLVAPVHPAGAAGAPSASDARAAAPAGRAVPTVTERRVRLGHKPVILELEHRAARLTFRGRRGQLVHLAGWGHPVYPCVSSRLRRAGGSDVRPWVEGYWRLRRGGTYTVVAKPCADDRWPGTKIQVREVVVHDDLAIDGPPAAVGRDHDVTHLARVPVNPGEPLVVDNFFHVTHVIMPGDSAPRRVARDRIHLEVGTRPAYSGPVSPAGDHYLVTLPEREIRVTRVLQHEGVLDGRPIRLDDQGIPQRVHQVAFEAPAGAWVYGVVATSSGIPVTEAYLVDARGEPLRGDRTIPAAGSYRMRVTVPAASAGQDVSLRIRTAAVAEPLTLDGPSVTYTATTPGQWLVGTMPAGLGYGEAQATVTDASPSLGDWSVWLITGEGYSCDPDSTANGCGDYGLTRLTPTQPTAPVLVGGSPTRSQVVVRVPPTAQGSLSLALTRR